MKTKIVMKKLPVKIRRNFLRTKMSIFFIKVYGLKNGYDDKLRESAIPKSPKLKLLRKNTIKILYARGRKEGFFVDNVTKPIFLKR